MLRRAPRSTRTDPPCPYTPRFRSSLLRRGPRPRGRRAAGLRRLGRPRPPAAVRLRHGPDRAPRDDDRPAVGGVHLRHRSEEHTSELQSLMRISYAVFCLKTNTNEPDTTSHIGTTLQYLTVDH